MQSSLDLAMFFVLYDLITRLARPIHYSVQNTVIMISFVLSQQSLLINASLLISPDSLGWNAFTSSPLEVLLKMIDQDSRDKFLLKLGSWNESCHVFENRISGTGITNLEKNSGFFSLLFHGQQLFGTCGREKK